MAQDVFLTSEAATEYLGSIEGSVQELSETSVGTLVIPAGTLEANDAIYYKLKGHTDDAVAGSVKVQATINAVVVTYATSIVFATRIKGEGYIEQGTLATDNAIINFDGYHNLLTQIGRVNEADTNAVNPMTNQITLALLLAAPNALAITSARVDFFRTRGSG